MPEWSDTNSLSVRCRESPRSSALFKLVHVHESLSHLYLTKTSSGAKKARQQLPEIYALSFLRRPPQPKTFKGVGASNELASST